MVHIVSQIYYLVSLKKQRRDSRLILLYKRLTGKASIPIDDLIPLVRRCRDDHSMAYQVPIANTDTYNCSLAPRPLGTGMHFQTLLSPLLKVPRMALLRSLLWWELGTSLPGHGPGEWLSFWRVTSNNSDSGWIVLAISPMGASKRDANLTYCNIFYLFSQRIAFWGVISQY